MFSVTSWEGEGGGEWGRFNHEIRERHESWEGEREGSGGGLTTKYTKDTKVGRGNGGGEWGRFNHEIHERHESWEGEGEV
jgi:hypothetical protein